MKIDAFIVRLGLMCQQLEQRQVRHEKKTVLHKHYR